MADLPLLYSFRRCPYAIRARLALVQAGVAFALHEVDLKHKPAGLLAASPKATVPVLCLPGGTVLPDSLAIMRWALAQNDPHGWLHSAHPQRDAALVESADGAFKHWLDRYKYLVRHPGETAEHCRAAAGACLLAALESALAQSAAGGSPWLSGRAHPCLADAATVPLVRQFAGVDAAWFASAPWPHTQAWLARWLASPLWAQVMAKSGQPAVAAAAAFASASGPASASVSVSVLGAVPLGVAQPIARAE